MSASTHAFSARIYELVTQGNCEAADEFCNKELEDNPSSPTALGAKGLIHVVKGEYIAALPLLRRAVRGNRVNGTYRSNLGIAYLLSGDYRWAVHHLLAAKVISKDAFHSEAIVACRYRALQLYQGGRWKEAALMLRKLVAIVATDGDSWNNLGALCLRLGMIRYGIKCLQQAISIDPSDLTFRSNLAVALNYRDDLPAQSIHDAHSSLFSHLQVPFESSDRTPSPTKRLHLGYYSADFCFRPLAFFLPPLLKWHDRSRFHISCYSNTKSRDEYTALMQNLADEWHDIRGMSDQAVSHLIQENGIDILIDTSGHFEGGRPGLFAAKPAPVQTSFLGYPATTGVPGIDYRITDVHADPPGMTEHLFSEKLIHLPQTFACYSPPARSPRVPVLPALRSGHVTFGCFQKREKVTITMLQLWSQVLKAVPDSRLLFHQVFSGTRFVAREFRASIEKGFRRQGITSDRLLWIGYRTFDKHLATISRTDIALDTFPYNGTATTCECLWMGVPVVTLAGGAHISRVGLTFLKSLGLDEWVASSGEEYVRIAVERAQNLSLLAETRTNLRARMLNSALTDSVGYTKAFEEQLRRAWNSWCASQPQPCP